MANPATITEIDRLLAAGAIVGGKYRVVRKLGAGAMGIVVAAQHLELGESIALKILNPELRGNREALARFTREARAMFALKGPHVGRVFDVGKLDSGEPFIVMELLAGMTLKESLEKTPRPKLEDSITLMKQIAEAVGEAHAINIIHRDLKPENIFVSEREGLPFAKVIDFGMSKARLGSRPELTLTSADAMLGTPRYMAPEQFLNSQTADARSDVWSLGVIFYRMITGKFPFDARDAADLLTQIRTKRPKLPHEVATDIRTDISAIAMRCLAQRPQERFANARELGAALVALSTPKKGPTITIKRPAKDVVVTETEASADDPTMPHKRALLPLAAMKTAPSGGLDAAVLPPSSRSPQSFSDELTHRTARGQDGGFADVDTKSDPTMARPDGNANARANSDDENFEVDTLVGPLAPPPQREDTTTRRHAVQEAQNAHDGAEGESTDVTVVSNPGLHTPGAMRSSNVAPPPSHQVSPGRADPFSETRRFSGVLPTPAPMAVAPPASTSALPTLARDSRKPSQPSSPWSGVAIAIVIGAALSTVALVAVLRYRQSAHATSTDPQPTASMILQKSPLPTTNGISPNPVNQGLPAITAPTLSPSVGAQGSPPTTANGVETSRPQNPPPHPPRPRNTAAPHGPNDPNW